MPVVIETREIPQADRIDRVGEVVIAVAQGALTFQDIAMKLDVVERQGRYYRLAAELLGLVQNHSNQASLTPRGQAYVAAGGGDRSLIMARAVMELRLFQRVVGFLEARSTGASTEELTKFMTTVADIGNNMAARRRSTVVAWLTALGLAREDNGLIHLVFDAASFAKPINVPNAAEPLLPKSFELAEYETVASRVAAAQEDIVMQVSSVARERANRAHLDLVNLVASRIRRAGAIPRYNNLIDLAAEIGLPLLFEMKSVTEGNARAQIRAGISQLYEYRYLQARPDAVLVLVTETAPVAGAQWMSDYLEKDRGILHLWDGDGNLYASASTQAKLQFLWS